MRFGALAEAIRPPLATALGISVASHLAVYGLTPVLSLHLVALGGTSAQVGILFSVFSVVAMVLRPVAGVWIDRQGIRWALLPGAGLTVVSPLGLQAAAGPAASTTRRRRCRWPSRRRSASGSSADEMETGPGGTIAAMDLSVLVESAAPGDG